MFFPVLDATTHVSVSTNIQKGGWIVFFLFSFCFCFYFYFLFY